MEWRPRLTAVVEALKRDPRIAVGKAELADGAPAGEIAKAEAAAGGALPRDVAAFYREVNGFVLEWQGPADLAPGATVRGAINLLPVARVFGDWNDAVFGQPIKPFDLFVPEACAALWWPPGAGDSSVRFHVFGEATVDTHYGFVEYIERLLVSRGFWYWIQALSKETAGNPEAEAFRTIAPRLFPDCREALFQPR